MLRVVMADDDIALYHTVEGFFATSDICSHGGESLTMGRLKGCIVQCPKHGGKFDVTTGQPTAFPCVYAVQTYAVEVRDDDLWLDYA